MIKKALIFGVSGQDGAYLSRLLLDKGYEVYGTSREAGKSSYANLELLEIRHKVKTEAVNTHDFSSVLNILIRIKPDEIYNLSGQSSVARSFSHPVETLESIILGTISVTEAIRVIDKPMKFYNAGSGECFGGSDFPANEMTPFSPRSPYAVAKASAYWQVANYRESFKIFACTGILFNHDSPLRPENFVTQKIVSAACRIASGSKERLRLGNISILRDWGWAPDYVEAMWLMLQQDYAEDFVIATGQSFTLEQFVRIAFSTVGLDWVDYVEIDNSLYRPTDILSVRADPSKALAVLGWQAKHDMHEVIKMMIDCKLASIKKSISSLDMTKINYG